MTIIKIRNAQGLTKLWFIHLPLRVSVTWHPTIVLMKNQKFTVKITLAQLCLSYVPLSWYAFVCTSSHNVIIILCNIKDLLTLQSTCFLCTDNPLLATYEIPMSKNIVLWTFYSMFRAESQQEWKMKLSHYPRWKKIVLCMY